MIKVVAVTAGRNDPCARFRVRQYMEPLHASGIEVRERSPRLYKYHEYSPPRQPFTSAYRAAKLATCLPPIVASWSGQVTWLQREMYHGLCTLEGLAKRPIVFDVDDAIWLQAPESPAAIAKIARLSRVVMAGNAFLADWFSQYAQEIQIVPTAVDCDRFRPDEQSRGRNSEADDFVIGWVGTHWNLFYLQALDKPLSEFVQRHPNVRLHVVANERPVFEHLGPERVRFIPWSAETEVEAIQGMDVGLMPLPDNEWARGKCSFKMLQYMACGLPVIVSPVGMNAEVLALGNVGLGATADAEWFEALELLIADRSLARSYGTSGRQVVQERFSRAVVSSQIAGIFKALN